MLTVPLTVLRERYLRDDVGCGIRGCGICRGFVGMNGELAMLPSEGDKTHPSFPDGHVLLPDTNIFLSQVRVVASPCCI